MNRLPLVLRSLLLGTLLSSLAACGTESDPSASVRIGAAALQASSLEGPGGTHLDVPAGASDVDVTVVLSAPRSRRPAPAGTTVVATPVRLGPEGQTFQKPLELTIPISPSALPAGKTIMDVIVVRAPQGSDVFVPLPTRRTGSAVIAQTEHFSDFLAVVVDDVANPPFGGCLDAICAPTESCSSCAIDCGLCLPSPDTTPPSVTTLVAPDPLMLARGDVVVSVDFDEALLPASVSPFSFRLMAGATLVDGTYAVTGSNVTFTPTAPLRPNTNYALAIQGVRDLAGNLNTVAYTNNFTTKAGAVWNGSSPTDGAVEVDPFAGISLVYSPSIDGASVTMQPVDGPCTGTAQLSADGFATCLGGVVVAAPTGGSVDITPDLPFAGNATIALRYVAGAVDGEGFALSNLGQLTFFVGSDTTGPSVKVLAPSNGATDVPLTTAIVATFDENFDPTSVTATTFAVTLATAPVLGTFSISGRTVTFSPMVPLDPGATYTVAIAGVKDALGNANGTPAGASFTTHPRPSVVSSVPGNGGRGVHPRQDLVLDFTRPIAMPTFTMQATDSTTCTGSVQVSDGTTCYGGSLVASASSITLRPTTSLPLGTNITVSIRSSATDSAGLAFAGGAVLSFTVSPTNGFAYVIAEGPFSLGNLGGLAGADLLCDPTGTGRRKAFLMTATRRPCTTSNCGGGATPMDWVLAASQTYVDAAGALLFTTDASAPIFTGWPMAKMFSTSNTNFFWGGSVDWLASGSDCNGWTDGTAGFANTVGYELASDSGFISGGSLACSFLRPILCVEQPPAVLPALH